MENKRKAILEVLGYNFEKATARKFFFNVYKYILYNDTDSLLETLEYKRKIAGADKSRQGYLVFKYMLRLLLVRHPERLVSLSPVALQPRDLKSPYFN